MGSGKFQLTLGARPLDNGRTHFRVWAPSAENEPQDVKLVKPPAEGGHGADALWVDDFHHSAKVATTAIYV